MSGLDRLEINVHVRMFHIIILLLTVKTLLELMIAPPQAFQPQFKTPTKWGNSSIVALLPPKMKFEVFSALENGTKTRNAQTIKSDFILEFSKLDCPTEFFIRFSGKAKAIKCDNFIFTFLIKILNDKKIEKKLSLN